MVVRKAKSPSWIKRGTATVLFLAAAVSGVAVFSGNLASIVESFEKFKWWGPQSPSKIALRDLRTVSMTIPGPQDATGKLTFEVEGVVAKTGEAALTNCAGQLTLGPTISFSSITRESGAAWKMAQGEHQELRRYHFDLEKMTYLGGKMSIRVICDDLITQWYFVTRLTIKANEGGGTSVSITDE